MNATPAPAPPSAIRAADLFDAMLVQQASDLHLGVGSPPMLRVRGELEPLAGHAAITGADMDALCQQWLSPEQLGQYERERDFDFAYAFGERARFRGNLLYKLTGKGAVFRTIPSKIVDLASLATPPAVATLATARAGLVLVTGPTGSGKSTTLAAMIDAINQQRDGHILTIEDPVEFTHRAKRCQITHREVGRDVVNYAEAIRSAGREDVDVILVGELRDSNTMRLALQAASAGALVFATVHTNSAASTIDRFINAFAADQQPAIRSMMAECLVGIVAQQLLRKKDGSGRCAVHEILLCNKAIASMIREGKTLQIVNAMQAGRGEGMQLMDDTLLARVADGTVAPADALAKAVDKATFLKDPKMVAAGFDPQAAVHV
jgi:twitching motility protein PilT